jgi:hypothetical protein
MVWTTALLVRHGSSHQQLRFFAQLKSAMERVTDLSPLEAIDILGEAGIDLPAAAIIKEETLRRFQGMAQVEPTLYGSEIYSKSTVSVPARFALYCAVVHRVDGYSFPILAPIRTKNSGSTDKLTKIGELVRSYSFA